MLFDYKVVIDYPWMTLGVLFIILVVKPVSALLIVLVCGHPLKTGLTVAAALAQIGEFSFILAELGKQLNLMPAYGQTVLIAAAIVSISINSFFFRYLVGLEPVLMKIGPLKRWLDRKSASRSLSAQAHQALNENEPNGARAVIVGYGIVGRTLAAVFRRMNINTMVIEYNLDTVLELKALGDEAIFGDATRKDILENAGLANAQYFVISISDMATTVAIMDAAHNVTTSIPTFVRCHYERDRRHLINSGAVAVASEEVLVAAAIAENVLGLTKASKFRVRREVKRIQDELGIKVTSL